ncbi:MAG: Serine-type D-Ala-D-Ala carboxypeptidase [Bacteroidota bacterium]|jgi:esterase/lipase
MKARRLFFGAVIAFDLIFLIYVFGPRVDGVSMDVTLPDLGITAKDIDAFLEKKEAQFPVKPDNESRVVWANTPGEKTAYAVVYLHGWSASSEEGNPVHRQIAQDLGANLYLPRLASHGLDVEDAMLDITADALVDSAKEALAIAQLLGDRVVIIATSNGGALALHLARAVSNLDALVLYSPNIEIYDWTAKLLDDPWGLQLARLVKGSDFNEIEMPEARKAYWYHKYRLESLLHLQAFVHYTMRPGTFRAVKVPVFLGYYYKNEEEQDKVVSVEAMLEMYKYLGTPDSLKQKVAFPKAGDHILANPLASKDVEGVYQASKAFLKEVARLPIQ